MQESILTSPAKKIPEDILCPITRQIMADPVMVVETGKTYEREAILKWFEQNSIDSLGGIEIKDKTIQTNWTVKQRINSLLEKRKVNNPEIMREVYLPISLIQAVILAIEKNNTKLLIENLEKNVQLLSAPLKDNKNLLMFACECSSLEVLNVILSKLGNILKDPIVEKDNGHLLFLMVSKRLGLKGAESMVKSLHWTQSDFQMFLFSSVQDNNFDGVNIALSLGACATVALQGRTALHNAALLGNKDIIQLLMQHNASIKVKNQDNKTPVELARENGHAELADYMVAEHRSKKLESYLKPLQTKIKEQAMTIQKQENEIESQKEINQKLKIKLKHFKEHSALKNYGNNPQWLVQNQLIAELLQGNIESVKKLEYQGASFLHPNKDGVSPLEAAIYSTNLEMLKYVEWQLKDKAIEEWAKLDASKIMKKLNDLTPTLALTMSDRRAWYGKYANAGWSTRYDERCLLNGYVLNLMYEKGPIDQKRIFKSPSINLYRAGAGIHAVVIHANSTKETINLSGKYNLLLYLMEKNTLPTKEDLEKNHIIPPVLIKLINEGSFSFYMCNKLEVEKTTFSKMDNDIELNKLEFGRNSYSHYYSVYECDMQDNALHKEIVSKIGKISYQINPKLEKCLKNLIWPVTENDNQYFAGTLDNKIKLTNLILSFCERKPVGKFSEFARWEFESWNERVMAIQATNCVPNQTLVNTYRHKGGSYQYVSYKHTLVAPSETIHKTVVEAICNDMDALKKHVEKKVDTKLNLVNKPGEQEKIYQEARKQKRQEEKQLQSTLASQKSTLDLFFNDDDHLQVSILVNEQQQEKAKQLNSWPGLNGCEREGYYKQQANRKRIWCIDNSDVKEHVLELEVQNQVEQQERQLSKK